MEVSYTCQGFSACCRTLLVRMRYSQCDVAIALTMKVHVYFNGIFDIIIFYILLAKPNHYALHIECNVRHNACSLSDT